MNMDFACISDCSQCCIEREYYPSKKFGKIGVLILPEEKERIERLAKKYNIKISILPRIAITDSKKIIAYQLMGVEKNGNLCPFLDVSSNERSPHGGYKCKIYQERPLACIAYPLNESNPIILDEKCKFCKEHKTADGNLKAEEIALLEIQSKMNVSTSKVWRYATNVGEESDMNEICHGWILD